MYETQEQGLGCGVLPNSKPINTSLQGMISLRQGQSRGKGHFDAPWEVARL